MHGVVARAEEDAAPQVGHLVGLPLPDSDDAAAVADVRQLLRGHRVPAAARQGRQHGEGEQRLQGAGRRQLAMRVVRGQHLAGTGVGDQPGQRGEVGQFGRAAMRPDLGALAEEDQGLRYRGCRRVRRRGRGGARLGDGHRGREGQHARHTEGAGRHGPPGGRSDFHMSNVETELPWCVLSGPHGVPEQPGCPTRAPRVRRVRRTERLSRTAASAVRGAETSRCRGSPASAPAGSPRSPVRRPCSAGPGAGRVRSSTRWE